MEIGVIFQLFVIYRNKIKKIIAIKIKIKNKKFIINRIINGKKELVKL